MGGGRTYFFSLFLAICLQKILSDGGKKWFNSSYFSLHFSLFVCVQVCFQVTLKTFEFNLNMPGRHCCVSGCSNGDNKLKKWKSGLCEVHSCHFGTARCTCGPPPPPPPRARRPPPPQKNKKPNISKKKKKKKKKQN